MILWIVCVILKISLMMCLPMCGAYHILSKYLWPIWFYGFYARNNTDTSVDMKEAKIMTFVYYREVGRKYHTSAPVCFRKWSKGSVLESHGGDAGYCALIGHLLLGKLTYLLKLRDPWCYHAYIYIYILCDYNIYITYLYNYILDDCNQWLLTVNRWHCIKQPHTLNDTDSDI